ncbi:MAG TPA: sensor histidine kinase [Verrucomicrobiae bacterium]|nr:sensor histidine kinase [Verrucomicrobiae bacterium]
MADVPKLLTGVQPSIRCRRFTSAASLIVIFTGLLALLGCVMHVEVVAQLQPTLVPMKFNTAGCFVLLGASLWLSRSDSTTPARRLWVRCLSLAVSAIGLLTLVEWLSGQSLGIDELFFREYPLTGSGNVPGRMAAASALDFALLGAALSWLDAKCPRGRCPSEWLAIAAILVALLAFIAYFYSIGSPYKIPPYVTIALDTIIGFLLLSVGVLCARPDRGLAAILIDTKSGSVLARRLLPVAVFLPPLMAWLRLLVQRKGYVDPVVGAALFTMAFILIWTALIWRTATAINRAEGDLHQLSGRLLALQDEERRHIARELHDSTAQNLGVVTLNLGRVRQLVSGVNEESQMVVAETLGLAEQCLREIRTMSYLLHPPLLDEAGLAVALQWYVEGFTKRSGIPVELAVPAEMERLPGDFEIALFRVVQEGLTNIHRHANCHRASIRVVRDGDRVTLEIRDDGKGMNRGNGGDGNDFSTFGVGIMGMRERLRQLGGGLELESDKHGTTVRAALYVKGNGR